jgi:SAM-dependent methyltransferase
MAWYDDDEFYSLIEPGLCSSERLAIAPREVEAMLRLLELPPGARLLEMAAGPGAHAVAFAQRGMRVTAVDRTWWYLERASRAAQGAKVEVEVVKEDMRNFVRPRGFDAATCLDTSIGIFERAEDNLKAAGNIVLSLKPGGVALFEMIGRELIKGPRRDWVEVEGDFVLEEMTPTDGGTWVDRRLVAVRKGETKEMRISHPLYSGPDLRGLLLEAGFSSVELYGSYAGAQYDAQAESLIAVARN